MDPAAASVVTAAALGGAIGSFVNVVAHRLPRGESLLRPASRCPDCGARVRPYDNVPVLSWFLLRGRCRDCRSRISARYPLVELATAMAFAAVALARGLDLDLLLELPFAAVLVAVAAIDVDRRIVPNRILLPAAVWALVGTAALAPGQLAGGLAAGAGAFAFMLAIVLVHPSGMGMGDVKLAGVMGLYLGIAVIPALVVAFATGALVGIALIARHGAAARKRALPFAPFLALGGLVGLVAGGELVRLYAQSFL